MSPSMEDLVEDTVLLQCRINGQLCEEFVQPGLPMLDFLREQRRLTGTHMGCKTGHCGACTVLVDGEVAKSCLCMAASLEGRSVTTLEGLAAADGTLHEVQQAMHDANAFQCGFCAPGMVLTAVQLLRENPAPDEEQIRAALAGNLCRCTGYRSIVAGVQLAGQRLRESRSKAS
jgi:aerobic carbon-monoxide dehydrogenase small subunit